MFVCAALVKVDGWRQTNRGAKTHLLKRCCVNVPADCVCLEEGSFLPWESNASAEPAVITDSLFHPQSSSSLFFVCFPFMTIEMTINKRMEKPKINMWTSRAAKARMTALQNPKKKKKRSKLSIEIIYLKTVYRQKGQLFYWQNKLSGMKPILNSGSIEQRYIIVSLLDRFSLAVQSF